MRVIYADNNATTQVAPEVYEAMTPFLTGDYFNPSSMYEPARRTAAAISQARSQTAEHLGVTDPKQILFTSCATESNNTAIYGTAKANPHRRHIITTAVEHPAVLEVCKDLQRSGYEVTFLGVDGDGSLDVGEFVRALRPDTLLVSIMHANNETGVIFPVAQLARITKETDPSIVFHTDATQSVGKVPLHLEQEYRHVDLLSFSGHKLHAPKGIGVLYMKRGTPCRPLLIGGHQEEGRRAGTENTPYIVGLAKALELAAERYEEEETRIRGLRDRLETAIEKQIPQIQVNGRGAPPVAQYPERILSLRGRGSDAVSVERLRDLRLQRFRLHVRVAGAISRLESHARSVHRRSRLRAIQLQSVQYTGRCGADHPGLSPDRGQLAQAITVLGPRAQSASQRCG